MKSLDLFLESITNIDNEINKLSGGSAKYYIKQVKEYVEGLFSFSKFKLGNKVKLKETLTFEKEHGWRVYEPTMVRGAIATITEVNWYKDAGFVYSVVFDKQLWRSDMDNMIKESDCPATFRMKERNFELEEAI